MKYRLALKIGHPHFVNARSEVRPSGVGAIGWAVLALGKKMETGEAANLPKKLIDQAAQAAVMVYSKPEQMLDPMPLEVFETKLADIAASLPKDCKLVRVQFDSDAYHSWRGKRPDAHSLRARWAQEQLT